MGKGSRKTAAIMLVGHLNLIEIIIINTSVWFDGYYMIIFLSLLTKPSQ